MREHYIHYIQAAEKAGIHPSTVRRAIFKNELDFITKPSSGRSGKGYYVNPDEVLKYKDTIKKKEVKNCKEMVQGVREEIEGYLDEFLEKACMYLDNQNAKDILSDTENKFHSGLINNIKAQLLLENSLVLNAQWIMIQNYYGITNKGILDK